MIIQLSEVIATLGVIGVNEVIDDPTMREVNDHLSYKTYVVNFFNFFNFANFANFVNSANFVNFKQVKLAKLKLLIEPMRREYIPPPACKVGHLDRHAAFFCRKF